MKNPFLIKEPNGYFYIYFFRSNGKRTKISTKTKNKNKAISVFIRFSSNYNNGFEKIVPISLIDLKNEFISYFSNQKAKQTINSYINVFNCMINLFGPDTILSCIPVIEFNKFLFQKSLSLKPDSYNIFQILFFYVIKFAKKMNYLQPDFLPDKIKVPKIERLPKYFTHEQLAEFFHACMDKNYSDIILTAYFTGFRESELINLKWNDIDFSHNTIKLSNEEFITKTRNPRIIPLNPEAKIILENRYEKNKFDYVFYRITKSGIPKKWKSTTLVYHFNKLKIKVFGPNCNLTFHSLRHSFATHLIQKNVPIFTVSKLLGHKDIQTTMIYAHFQVDKHKDEVNLLSLN